MNKKLYFAYILLLILLPGINLYAWQLDIPVSASETFNDNINASADNQNYDFITDLMAGIELTSDWKAHELQFSTHIYQQIYKRNFGMSNNSQDAQVNYTRELSPRSSITLNDTFHHYPEPRTYDYMFGLTGGRNTYYVNTASVNYQRYLTQFLGINLHYQNTVTEYSSASMIDSRANNGGGALTYDWSSRNATYLSYDFTYTEYSTNEKIPLHTGLLGHRFNFTTQLYTNLAAGADYTITQDGPSYNPHFLISLVNDVDRRNQLNITFTKSYIMTPYEDDVFNQWQVSLGWTHELTERWTGNANGFLGKGEYINTGVENRLIGFNIAMSYIILEEINAGIRYGITRNDTSTPGQPHSGYIVNTITVFINAVF